MKNMTALGLVCILLVIGIFNTVAKIVTALEEPKTKVSIMDSTSKTRVDENDRHTNHLPY
jgi:hypothetical protein